MLVGNTSKAKGASVLTERRLWLFEQTMQQTFCLKMESTSSKRRPRIVVDSEEKRSRIYTYRLAFPPKGNPVATINFRAGGVVDGVIIFGDGPLEILDTAYARNKGTEWATLGQSGWLGLGQQFRRSTTSNLQGATCKRLTYSPPTYRFHIEYRPHIQVPHSIQGSHTT